MDSRILQDGIHGMVPRDRMPEHVRKLRDTYARTPGAPFVQREFYFYTMQQFHDQGLDPEADIAEEFGYDPPGSFDMKHLGWCEAEFCPAFKEEVLEVRGENEVIRDFAGRHLLVFKGRRQGFMPQYMDHPVKDQKTWEEDVKWRMDPGAKGRFDYLDDMRERAIQHAAQGYMMSQHLVGGYMYLRSLFGPTEVMFAFHDMPELIHDCMQTWLALAEAVIAKHQAFVTLDEFYIAEDICYNGGPLCSPDTMKEFLFPYYQQLMTSVRRQQIDQSRHLYVQVDTDGRAEDVIRLYQEAIGMDAMSPFEVASGCDVVALGKAYPELAMFGGIDKRELAKDKAAIDRMVERILPVMRERGGYIPHCDHAVPEEVSLENYRHYRKRCLELGG